MAITPDGKTLYVISSAPTVGRSDVLPITTATNTLGTPIKIEDADSVGIVMNPDGRTAYVLGQSMTGIKIIPIATATNTPGSPVSTGQTDGALAITPDGQILYLADYGPNGVIPFATATKRPGKLIKIDGAFQAMAVTPDGNTAYVSSQVGRTIGPSCTGQTGEVTPIATATNVPGRPIRVGCNPDFLAVTPDGTTVWVASGGHIVTPIATATNTAGKPVKIRGSITAMAVCPDRTQGPRNGTLRRRVSGWRASPMPVQPQRRLAGR